METRLKEYTEFIEKAVKKPSKELARYHREMVTNFQHERLVHLLIMLFFVSVTLAMIGITVFLNFSITGNINMFLCPMYAIDVILMGVCGFYVKHYYVLENGVQNLYKYSKLLYQR